MNLESDKRLNIQLRLDFSSAPTGEARQARREDIESLSVASEPERPANTSRIMEEICERANLKEALRQVRGNKGSAGVDRMTVDQLGDYLKQHWPVIREQLLNGTYEPKPVKRVEIPKPDGGGVRKLGIPMRPAYCTLFNSGWNGDTGRVGNPIPQSVICRVGDGDDVWQAKLPLLCCYEAPVDPVINHPHTDAVSFANLFDVERIGGKRRAGNVMLVTDPTDHGDREAPASRAFEAVAVEERDDLIVIVRGCQGTDVSNERIGITNRFSAVRRQA